MEELNSKDNVVNNNRQEIRDRSINRLYLLLNDFSDEIPSEIIHSFAVNNKFKVRAARWTSLCFNVNRLKDYDLIDNELYDEYLVCETNHTKSLKETGRTQKEDIENMNNIIEKIIQNVKSKN